IRNGRLPENWLVANPQFGSAVLSGNFANSTYHALQIELERRARSGTLVRANYTWSKALGEEEGSSSELRDDYRTIRDRSLDKRLLGFHRTHAVSAHAIWELPVGPGRRFFNRRGVVGQFTGGWQIGTIFQLTSGAPLQLTSSIPTLNNAVCC